MCKAVEQQLCLNRQPLSPIQQAAALPLAGQASSELLPLQRRTSRAARTTAPDELWGHISYPGSKERGHILPARWRDRGMWATFRRLGLGLRAQPRARKNNREGMLGALLPGQRPTYSQETQTQS